MRRGLIGVVLFALLLPAFWTSTASAEVADLVLTPVPLQQECTQRSGELRCTAFVSEHAPGSPGSPGTGGASNGSGGTPTGMGAGSTDDRPPPCSRKSPAVGDDYFVCVSETGDWDRIQPTRDGTWGSCQDFHDGLRELCRWNPEPDDPMDPGAEWIPPRGPTPGELWVTSYLETIAFPAPDPYIAPGKAITGLASFMETRNQREFIHHSPDTPFGSLLITATGRYQVDWGDGAVTGPHSFEGTPWPDGQMTHTYIDIGTYDVVVTQTWTANWTFGNESGVIDGIATFGTIDDFPVGQLQAVVVG